MILRPCIRLQVGRKFILLFTKQKKRFMEKVFFKTKDGTSTTVICGYAEVGMPNTLVDGSLQYQLTLNAGMMSLSPNTKVVPASWVQCAEQDFADVKAEVELKVTDFNEKKV
jgi:hypothetical protein